MLTCLFFREQQALSLFRTQRIVKIYLELDSTASKLTAEVSAENGGAHGTNALNVLAELWDQKCITTSHERMLHAGLEKQYIIPCMDAEILQTSVDKDTFPTCVNAAANELNRSSLPLP